MDRALRTSFLLAFLVSATLPVFRVWAGEAEDRYAVAAAHYAAKRWDLADQEFATLLENHPAYPRRDFALFYHGETLVQLRKFDLARQQFLELLEKQPQSRFVTRGLFRCGEAAYLSGRLDEAATDLNHFVQQHPQDDLGAFALTYLGEIALAKGDGAGAEKQFATALKQFPENPLADDCRLGLARALDSQGKLDDARPLYEEVAEASGSAAADALYRLGQLHYRAERYDEAESTLNRLLSKKITAQLHDKTQLALGQVHFRQKRYAEAEKLLRPLAQRRPPPQDNLLARAQYWLGLVYRAQENWSAAASALREAATISKNHPREAAARFFAGDVLLRNGNLADASAEFEKGLACAAAGYWADDCWLGRIRAAAELNQDEQAVALCRDFRERFARSSLLSEVAALQATSLIRLEQFAEAAGILETLIGNDRTAEGAPADETHGSGRRSAIAPETHAQLAICYAHLGQFEKSRDAYERLRKLAADSAIYLVTTKHLAEIALSSGQREWSQQLFTSLASIQTPPAYGNETSLGVGAELGESSDPSAAGAGQTRQIGASASSAKTERTNTAVDGLSGLAWAQLQGNELRASAATFAQILELHPDDPRAAEAALTRGQILERLGELNPALTMYHLVLKQYAKSKLLPQALLSAARLHDRLEQDADAQRYYQQLVTQHPTFEHADEALYGWAWLLRENGETSAAGAKFRELRQRYPKSAYREEATYLLAEDAATEENYDVAVQLLAELTEPGSGGPTGNGTAGRGAVGSASATRKDDSVSQPSRAAQAKIEQTSARSNDPNRLDITPRALYLTGRIALARQQWDQVEAPMDRLISEYPRSDLRLPAEYWIAEAAYRAGEYDKAEARLAALSGQSRGRDDDWLAMVPLRRAQILAQRKQWTDALEMAKKIEKQYPSFKQQYEVDYLIGRCLAARGELADAREAYLRVIRAGGGAKTETAAMAQWMIGETLMHEKRYEEARREYLRTEILYAFPEWQARALLQAGKCHELQGEWRQAIAVYSELKKKYAQSSSLEEATRRMNVARQRAARVR